MSDKAKDPVPEPAPYENPTLELNRPRSSMLESDDDLDLDQRSFESRSAGAYDGPTDPIHRPEMPVAPGSYEEPEPVAAVPPKVRRGTLDLGLLILRLAVGGIMIVHGLQKLTGWWDGPGLDGFEALVEGAGYRYSEILAIVGAIGEVAAGTLLVLGLLTPLAAAAVVAIMINAVLFKHHLEPGLQYFAAEQSGVEFEILLGAAAVAIVLTGPGRIAVDGARGWATRPFIGSFVALLLGVAGGVCLWLFVR
ncbi:DoxX family protein [Rhodococcus sp. CX]|uniref:DoxX family protein n=1 Tax=Rhodococcus sp. CX TaxID=2789880 RepID=UPI0027DACBAD|nr:DoxX family protein [Rhodococcus sp. CX]